MEQTEKEGMEDQQAGFLSTEAGIGFSTSFLSLLEETLTF